ncbi:MAG TPA: hypothetical protein VGF13_09545, partial [Verrucomicrobiae bacterium]
MNKQIFSVLLAIGFQCARLLGAEQQLVVVGQGHSTNNLFFTLYAKAEKSPFPTDTPLFVVIYSTNRDCAKVAVPKDSFFYSVTARARDRIVPERRKGKDFQRDFESVQKFEKKFIHERRGLPVTVFACPDNGEIKPLGDVREMLELPAGEAV